MKNIWTQHLEKSNDDYQDKGDEFTQMLHYLVRTGNDTDAIEGETLIISGNSDFTEISFTDEDENDVATVTEDTKNKGKADANDPEIEIFVWKAESQKGYELGNKSLGKDYVKLLMAENGRLFLRYDVVGENSFEMNVGSEYEALEIIQEDNLTTGQLYPGNPELKWIKIK